MSVEMPESPLGCNPILSVVTRSGGVESWHRGAVAVWHDGAPLLQLGATDHAIFARSAVKPLQALPFLERGLHQRLGLSNEQLAVLCASHDGTARHVAAVRSLLERAGRDERELLCGPHAPFCRTTRQNMLRDGQKPLRVHNNCSGKHAGFLCLQHELGGDLADYLDPDGAAQREVGAAVAAMAGRSAPLPTGLDGCGAPTFVMPLDELAAAFCRLANPEGAPPVRAAACRTILDAVGKAPELLAGEQRFCTALVRQWPGRSFAKNGAEGVYAAALSPDPRRRRAPGALGVAIKCDDGAERGYQPVLVDLLRWLGAFDGEQVPEPLQRFWRVPIHNTQKKPVGEVRCVVDWQRLEGGAA